MRAFRTPVAIMSAALLLAMAPLSNGIAGGTDVRIGDIVIEAPWTRATPAGSKVAVGYLAIVNIGKNADRLVAATSPISERVEIHTMTMTDGVMRMRKLDKGIVLKPQSVTELKPGGDHLMFIGLKAPIKKGDVVPVEVTFEGAGKATLKLAAAAIGARKAPGEGIGPAAGSNSGKPAAAGSTSDVKPAGSNAGTKPAGSTSGAAAPAGSNAGTQPANTQPASEQPSGSTSGAAPAGSSEGAAPAGSKSGEAPKPKGSN